MFLVSVCVHILVSWPDVALVAS